MARDFFINGETMILVKGATDTGIPTLSELGLAMDPVRIRPRFRHKDINVDAFGEGVPEVQFMLLDIQVSFTLIHFDQAILRECTRLAMGGPAGGEGTMARAGTRLGGGVGRFAPGNKYVGLNLSSPVGQLPWCFFFSYLTEQPFEWPLGTEKSMVPVTFRAIPFTTDPANALGAAQGNVVYPNTNPVGALNYPIYSHVLDT